MNYESRIKKKTPIIILHGWGLKGSAYKDLVSILEKKGRSVYFPDLPGFGTEPLRKQGRVRLQGEAEDKRGREDEDTTLILDDYVVFLRKFIERNKIKEPIIIGHSFGGRVALKYCWRYPSDVSKVILTGTPIIRHKTLKMKIAFLIAVTGGKVLKAFPLGLQRIFRKILYKSIGEWDYYKAGPLKAVFKNIIGEELIVYAKSLKMPVLLVWGKDDSIVPSSDVKLIKKIIPHAQSVIVNNTGHKLSYFNSQEFYTAIKNFL